MTFLALGVASSSANSSTISDVEPGLLGFLVVAALGIALVFLLRSMNKQFKKIGPRPADPDPFPTEEASSAEASSAEASTAEASATQVGLEATAGAPAEPDTGRGFVPETGATRSGRRRS